MQTMNMQEIGMTLTEFRDFISGKSIAVVGNSLDALDKEQGEQIDSADLTLRFGKGTPQAPIFDKIGSKTDIWVTGLLRSDRRKYLPPETITLWNNSAYNHLQGPKVIHPRLDMFTKQEIQDLKDEFSVPEHKRLSAGAIASLFLVRKADTWSRLDFFNFDFFTKHTNIYNHLADSNSLTSSWHLPLLKPEFIDPAGDYKKGNPAHDTDAEIRAFTEVLSKHKCYWHGAPLENAPKYLEEPTLCWTKGREPPRY